MTRDKAICLEWMVHLQIRQESDESKMKNMMEKYDITEEEFRKIIGE